MVAVVKVKTLALENKGADAILVSNSRQFHSKLHF